MGGYYLPLPLIPENLPALSQNSLECRGCSDAGQVLWKRHCKTRGFGRPVKQPISWMRSPHLLEKVSHPYELSMFLVAFALTYVTEITVSAAVFLGCSVLNVAGSRSSRVACAPCVTDNCSVCFRTVDSDFWNKFFGRILNADGKSTVPLLRELREEMSDMFDSCFQERLCESLAVLGETFLVENFM